jgi:TPP-dependent pyruvate/acetoin dehydrogenase alpha subunit
VKFDKALKLKFYKQMLLIRQFEYAVKRLLEQAEIKGTAHLYIGEEAIAAGVCNALQTDDYISSTHRGHGHCIAKGADVNEMMAELFGKTSGCCKGKGGSMHIADMKTFNLGANGIVAGGIPIATGAGLSIKMRDSKQVVACFFGDTATNEGAFHESVNMASIWNLPVIYICENNFYGISIHIRDAAKVNLLSKRMSAYDIPAKTIDGNNVIEVYEETKKAIDYARSGKGPYFLECITYRWEGHSRSDPCLYRPSNEKEEWIEKCPIKRLEADLICNNTDIKELEKIREGVNKQISDAIEFGRQGPDPAPEDLYKDLFCEDIIENA